MQRGRARKGMQLAANALPATRAVRAAQLAGKAARSKRTANHGHGEGDQSDHNDPAGGALGNQARRRSLVGGLRQLQQGDWKTGFGLLGGGTQQRLALRLAALAAIAALAVLVTSLGALALLMGGGSSFSGSEVAAASAADIPEEVREAYEAADEETAVPWVILAGIGGVQTDHGQQGPGEMLRRGTDPGTDLTPTLDPELVAVDGEGLFLTEPGFLDDPQRPAEAAIQFADEILAADVDDVDIDDLLDDNLADTATRDRWAAVIDSVPLTGQPVGEIAVQSALRYAGLATPITGGGTVADIPYADAFNQSTSAGVDPRLVAAVAYVESGFRPDVIDCTRSSPAGARGIMQFMPDTAANLGADPCAPNSAIPAAAQLLADHHATFGTWELALAAYNAGPGAVQRYGGIPPYPETQTYVTRVMAQWGVYQEQFPTANVEGGRGGTGPDGSPIQLSDVPAPGGGVITVNATLAPQLTELLNAAARDGLLLSGSGYRSHDDQIALRRAHCGPSDYDIFQAPASACSPPTARPGTSRHELGLAVDFDNCSSHSTACWHWLSANAAAYSFYNLPSESWHWSDTGG